MLLFVQYLLIFILMLTQITLQKATFRTVSVDIYLDILSRVYRAIIKLFVQYLLIFIEIIEQQDKEYNQTFRTVSVDIYPLKD